MNDVNRFVFRPLVLVGLGGLGCALLFALRAMLIESLGFLPGSARFLACDFASDPPRPPSQELPRVPSEIWEKARFSARELALVSLGREPHELAAQIASDPRLSWIRGIVPEDLIAVYPGNEAAQIPGFTRLALALTATNRRKFENPSWYELLDQGIADVGPGGGSIIQFGASANVASRIVDTDPTAVFIGGAQGGTATGALMAMALAAKSLSIRRNIRLQCDACVVTGPYRPKDDQDTRKAALEHALDIDLDHAMGSSRGSLTFALGSNERLEYGPRLFDRVYRQESWGKLAHNTGDVLALAVQTLAFRYFSEAGFRREKSRANDVMVPRVRKLAQQKTWTPVTAIQTGGNI